MFCKELDCETESVWSSACACLTLCFEDASESKPILRSALLQTQRSTEEEADAAAARA